MESITNKMATYRQYNNGGACKLFWPCNEGSGDTLTDKVNGIVLTDTATAEHTEPHAVGFVSASLASVTGLDQVSIGATGAALVCLKVGTSFALSDLKIGRVDIGVGLEMSGASTLLHLSSFGSVGGTCPGTAAAGDVMSVGMAWDSTSLFTYYGEDSDLSLVDTDAFGTLSTTLPLNFTANASVMNAVASSIYGIAVWDFDSGVPSDVLTAFNWMKDHWTQGDKILYPGWKLLK